MKVAASQDQSRAPECVCVCVVSSCVNGVAMMISAAYDEGVLQYGGVQSLEPFYTLGLIISHGLNSNMLR